MSERQEASEYKEVTAVEEDREAIVVAREKGKGALLGTFLRLSGPGWLQSAITLGGGSLAGALYLGVLGGYGLLWVQPLAMIMGVIMLSAISYVTLSTGRRPFALIKNDLSPVLGWGWAFAVLMANLVWILPQFAMTTAAAQQSVLPSVLGADGLLGDFNSKLIMVILLAASSIAIIWSYGQGGKGAKLFELILKLMVAVIVLSFFGVIIRLTMRGALDWGSIIPGFIPNLKLLANPADTFTPFLSEIDAEFRDVWRNYIVAEQRDVMISAAAVAVGINMTFLMPYALLKRGWDRDFRGLAIFDLSTGMFIPFLLVTAAIVIASGSQFHTQPAEKSIYNEVMAEDGETLEKIDPESALESRLMAEFGEEEWEAMSGEEQKAVVDALPEAELAMASMLVRRDSFDLAHSLEPLIGSRFSQLIFGIGVLGMGLSSAIIIMIINGFVVCEMLGRPGSPWVFRAGAILPVIGAVFGPFLWHEAAFYLVVPVSVLGMALLPIAYISFISLMNSPKTLGAAMPKGGKRILANTLMGIATLLASLGSLWSLWSSAQWRGIGAFVGFVLLILVVELFRRGKKALGIATLLASLAILWPLWDKAAWLAIGVFVLFVLLFFVVELFRRGKKAA